MSLVQRHCNKINYLQALNIENIGRIEKRLTEIMDFTSREVISVGEKTEHFVLMGYRQWHCELSVISALLQTAPDS